MTKKDPAAEAPADISKVVLFPAASTAPTKATRAAKLRSEQKWGVDVMAAGFCILPSLLFRAQHRLGLKSTHLAVIVQLADFWWQGCRGPVRHTRWLRRARATV